MHFVSNNDERTSKRSSLPHKDNYVLSRGYTANCRQNVQFYIWIDDGFILHPSIPRDQEDMRVAEIGVGTGIWLTHLSRLLPSSAEVHGFDIDLTAAPPEQWLPKNVYLHERDMLQPIPEELVGTFDLVHLQLFHLAVKDNDPVPIIRNLSKLLKPGGYISWGEYDYSTWSLVRTTDASPDNHQLTDLMDYSGTMGGTKPSWTREYWPARLPETFRSEGFTNVAVNRRMLPPEMIAYQLDTALTACEEMSYNAFDKLGGGRGETMRRMIAEAYDKRKQIGYDVGRLTVVAQKPLFE